MCFFCSFIFRLSIECRKFCADSRCQGSLRDHYDIYWALCEQLSTHMCTTHIPLANNNEFLLCVVNVERYRRARSVCPLQSKKNCGKRSKRMRRDKRHTYQCADWANTLNSHWAKARAKFYRYTTSHISNKHSTEKIPIFFLLLDLLENIQQTLT